MIIRIMHCDFCGEKQTKSNYVKPLKDCAFVENLQLLNTKNNLDICNKCCSKIDNFLKSISQLNKDKGKSTDVQE